MVCELEPPGKSRKWAFRNSGYKTKKQASDTCQVVSRKQRRSSSDYSTEQLELLLLCYPSKDTVQELTKHINFGNVYYLSAPIPNEEFGDMLGLWSSSQDDSSSAHTSTDDDDDAYYRGDKEPLDGDTDDVWVSMSDSDSTQSRGNPFMSRFSRETVLQNTWHKKKRARPLPEIPERQEIRDIPNWYDVPNEPDLESLVSGECSNSGDGSLETVRSTCATRDSSVEDIDENVLDSIYEEPTLVQTMDREQTRRKLKYMGEVGDHVINSSGETRSLPLPGYRKEQQEESVEIVDRRKPANANRGTPSDVVPAPLVPVCGNIIKMLKMPTISWSTLKKEEHEDPGLECFAPPTPQAWPGTKHMGKPKVDVPLKLETYKEPPPPPIPPRIPITMAISKQMTTQFRNTAVQSTANHVDSSIEDQSGKDDDDDDVNGSVVCEICETGNVDIQCVSIGHEVLHRLREKEAMLKKRNEIDNATINVSEKVNAQLKESLNNKIQLNKLEKEELSYESAIDNVGKQVQLDEYYAKFPPAANFKPNKVRIQTDTIDENQIYANPGIPRNSFRKISTKFGHSWSFVSAFSKGRKNRFSSKMYAADSGIENE